MARTQCSFYISVGLVAHVIDGWIEDGNIYSILYGGYDDVRKAEVNGFFKINNGLAGVYILETGEMVMYGGAIEEKLILFEVGKKWGYGNPWSNRILISPIYDFAWEFEGDGCAVVCKGGTYQEAAYWLSYEDCSIPEWGGGGRCGLISLDGATITPFEYDVLRHIAFDGDYIENTDGSLEIARHFHLAKRGNKWGLLDDENQIKTAFEWDNLCLFGGDNFLLGEKDTPCAGDDNKTSCSPKIEIKYTLFGKELQQIADGLDCEPYVCRCHDFSSIDEDDVYRYYVLKKGTSYGIVRSDGKMIAPIEMNEAEARTRLWNLGRTW